MSIREKSKQFFKTLCAGLLPQSCLLCDVASGHEILCADCSTDLPRLPESCCPQCALPTLAGEHCGRCLASPPHFDSTVAAFCYDFPLDQLVQSFKYQHRLALGAYFGEQLSRTLLQRQNTLPAFDCIMPLPLHPLRLRERGFNQALEIARIPSRRLGVPINTHDCQRQQHTPAQASLPWRERVKNIRGAFHCPSDLQGRHIALLDDVMTSGASLDECARTLKLHGAAHVTALVVARTLPR